nr:hypothetical protein [uncultured Deefgea sp.]
MNTIEDGQAGCSAATTKVALMPRGTYFPLLCYFYLVSAFGTLFYSRNPRQGLTFLASPRKVAKEGDPSIDAGYARSGLRPWAALRQQVAKLRHTSLRTIEAVAVKTRPTASNIDHKNPAPLFLARLDTRDLVQLNEA